MKTNKLENMFRNNQAIICQWFSFYLINLMEITQNPEGFDNQNETGTDKQNMNYYFVVF